MAALERIYTVNLSEAYNYIRTKRARRAVKLLRAFAARHMKAELENVKISNGTNSAIFEHVGVNHAATQNFEPAGVFAQVAALSLATARHIELCRGFGKRISSLFLLSRPSWSLVPWPLKTAKRVHRTRPGLFS